MAVLRLVLVCCLLGSTTLVFAENFPLAGVAQDNDSAIVVLDEDDLLVIELKLGPRLAGETLFVFQSPDATMVPLEPLIQSLEFPVDIDVDELLVEGWFITEGQSIFVDIPKRKYLSNDIEVAWLKNFRYAVDGFDLYVDVQTIEHWFDLKLNLDVSQLALSIESNQPLPLLEKIKRQDKREKIKAPKQLVMPEDYIRNRYEWFGKPQFDVSLSVDAERNRGDVDQISSAVVQGRMDIAKHSLRTSYINNDGEADLRLTLSKASEGPDDDIVLGIDRYEVGDIFGYSDPLLFSSVKGRGFHLKRGGNSAQERGSAIAIEGEAPPAWEVELYRNGYLVEFAEASADGRYEFSEVPTFVGENNFEIRVYGPQGQYRVARRQISIGGAMIKPGEWEYQVYGLNRNKNLIASTLNDSDEETNFFLSEAIYGVNEYLSVQAGLSKMTPNNTVVERDYHYLGLYGSVFGSLAQMKYAQDNDGGSAISASIKARVWDANINVDMLKFDGLISDRNQDGRLDSDVSIRFNRSLSLGLPSNVFVDMDLSQKRYLSGLETRNIRNRLSTGWAGFQFAHDLDYSGSSSSGSDDRLSGSLNATRKWLGWRLKGGAVYSVAPTGRLDTLVFGASYKKHKAFNYQGSIIHSFSGDDTSSFDSTITWNLNRCSVSLGGGINSHGLQRLGVSLNSSIGYEAANDQYYLSNDGLVNNASVTMHTFLDQNNNGQYDLGEEPVKGIKFKGRSHWRLRSTDDNGLVTLTGVRHLEIQKLEVDNKSIEDPFMQLSVPPSHLYTHSGTHTLVHLPFVNTIEIEGELALSIDGESTTSMGVSVYLLDQSGAIVAETQTEYDGVYLFDRVLPGTYTLSFDQHGLERRGFTVPESIIVQGSSDDGVVYLDLVALNRASENLN